VRPSNVGRLRIVAIFHVRMEGRLAMRTLAGIFVAAIVTCCSTAMGEELVMVAYNVESGEAQADSVAKEVEKLVGVDIWGFSELASYEWLETFEKAAEKQNGAAYGKIIGTTGDYDDPDREPDYLAFLYNEKKLDKLAVRQLHSMNDWSHRSPLVASFRLKSNNQEFLVVLNHLASGDEKLRMQQSWQLHEWAFFRSVPVVMLGDFNYRWKIGISELEPPRDYSALTHGGVLQWVRPDPLLYTWCGGALDSVFDFVFVNETATGWKGKADVIKTLCDKSDKKVSDHRPVRVRFTIP
jgi:endonuclease/exonuclease/phosphatase family metal-dependent hydrolase